MQAALAVIFLLLATANGAGYRYGVSDQAFYVPVVVRALNPAAFPKDATLIDAQGRLMLSDEALAFATRTTGLSLDTVFLGAYVVSMVLVWAGLSLIGASVYGNAVVTWTLLAAYTLRHRITKTSANSLEPYFHPRMLAFGFGLLAVAALLRRRSWAAIGLVAAAAAVHVTTGLWFAVLVGVALLVVETSWRTTVLPTLAVGLLAGGWALGGGVLDGRLQTMDPVWLRAVATKDSLFAAQWPVSAWLANLGMLGALWWAYRRRRHAGHATAADTGLVWGATALVAVFLITLPAASWGLAFFVQLQIPRVFWLLDVVATIYVLGAVAAGLGRRAQVALGAIVCLIAVGRGVFVMQVERPDRALFAVQLPADDWQETAAWVARQSPGTHVMADPGHAWKYGTSLRVSAERDVLLEEVKDSAVAIYSREVAARVVERTDAVGDFGTLTEAKARALAVQYDIDYLVTATPMALPEVHRNGRFHVYALTP